MVKITSPFDFSTLILFRWLVESIHLNLLPFKSYTNLIVVSLDFGYIFALRRGVWQIRLTNGPIPTIFSLSHV
jgi:NADH:ubiquinone oxidoreductase subunit 3 (subunit A)